jgi:hypothetical protein
MTEDIVGIARAAYDCYVTKDRAAIEALTATISLHQPPGQSDRPCDVFPAVLAEQRIDWGVRLHPLSARWGTGVRDL